MSNGDAQPLSESDLKDLFEVVFGHVAARELSTEQDERTALRKASLSLIVRLQLDAPELLRRYFRFLLYDFEPLSRHFDDNDMHDLFLDERVVRCKCDVDRGARLLVSESFQESLMNELR